MNVVYVAGLFMEKKCPVCKKPYTTFNAKSKYCSDACANTVVMPAQKKQVNQNRKGAHYNQ